MDAVLIDKEVVKNSLLIQRKRTGEAKSLFEREHQRLQALEALARTFPELTDESEFSEGLRFDNEALTPVPMELKVSSWNPKPGSIAGRVYALLAANPAGMEFTDIRDALLINPKPSDIEGLRSGVGNLVKRGWCEHPTRTTYRLFPNYLPGGGDSVE